MNTALDQLLQLNLVSMAQTQKSGIRVMSFEKRLALQVEQEAHGKQDRRSTSRYDGRIAVSHLYAKTNA